MVTTSKGEPWSDDMEQLLVLLIYRRFGRDSISASEALARLMQSQIPKREILEHVERQLERDPDSPITFEARRAI